VELHAKDGQVDETLEHFVAEIGNDLHVRVVLGASNNAVIPWPGPVIDLSAVATIITALHEPDRWIEVALDFARIESHLPQVVRVLDAGAKRIRAVPETGRTGYPRLGRCAATSGRIASAPPWMARSTAEDAGVASRLISAVNAPRAFACWTSPAAG